MLIDAYRLEGNALPVKLPLAGTDIVDLEYEAAQPALLGSVVAISACSSLSWYTAAAS